MFNAKLAVTRVRHKKNTNTDFVSRLIPISDIDHEDYMVENSDNDIVIERAGKKSPDESEVVIIFDKLG